MIWLTSIKRSLPAIATAFVFAFVATLGAATVQAQTADKAAAEKYNEGLGLLKEKDYEAALATFLETMEIADAAGDRGTSAKAQNYAYRLSYNVGVSHVKDGDIEGAMGYFNRGIEMEPEYYKNYKGLAMAYKEQGDETAAMEAFVKTSEVASEAGELEERTKAIAQAEGFVAKAMQAEDWTKVVENGGTFLQYSETANVHYYLAHAYNQLGNYQDALAHSDKALGLDQGSRASKARIHFEKAEAYRNIGQFDSAVQSYAEAAYGDYKQRSEYMIEELSGSE